MTTFSYYPNIPNAPDNPSYDQPLMQVNSQSINSIWSVDHVTFSGLSGSGAPGSSAGQHLQVTFNGKNTPGGTPIDPVSILYTASGMASTISDMRFQNANNIFPISCIRAFAYCDGAGAIRGNQTINVASVARGTLGIMNVTLTTNAVNSSDFLVFCLPTNMNLIPGYQITGVGTFNLSFIVNTGGLQYPGNFAFIVIQL